MITQSEINDELHALNDNLIIPSNHLAELIARYVSLIEKWNRTYNLTAAKNSQEIFQHHVMDSLSVLSYIKGTQVVDVGSGAGFPGIVIALAKPDWNISLIEANQKKASFLQQVKIELMLTNAKVVATRVEHFQPQHQINSIISRAFASLGDFISITQHLAPKGASSLDCQWIAMKAHCTTEELDQVQKPYVIKQNILLQVPGLEATRRLIVIEKLTEKDDSQFKQHLVH